MSTAESHATVFGTVREMSTTVRVLVVGNLITNLAAFLNAFLVLFLTHAGLFRVRQRRGVHRADGRPDLRHRRGRGRRRPDRVPAGHHLVDVGSAVLTALLVHAPNLWTIVVVAVLAGIFNQAYRPAAQAWVVELTPMNRQVMVFSFLRLTFNLGATLGPLGAALLLVYYSYTCCSTRTPTGSLAFGLVALVALSRTGRVQPTDAASHERAAAKRAGYRHGADRRAVRAVRRSASSSPRSPTSSSRHAAAVRHAPGHTEQTYALLLA